MIESLHRLIAQKGFEDFRLSLEGRFQAHGMTYKIHYGEPPRASLFVRLENHERIGEVCAWDSGDCEVQMAEFKKDGIESVHYQLQSDYDFHNRLAEIFRFVANKDPKE